MNKPGNHANQDEDHFDHLFKIILLGDSTVGKSSILLRYTKNDFKYDYGPTIGVEFASKKLTLTQNENKVIKVQIWDTVGQERFRAITKAYYRGAVGALLVYDITNKNSFHNVEKWYQEIKEHSQSQNYIVTMLVGNKSDLEQQRQVSKDEVSSWAEQNKIGFVEVSAFDGTNVEFTFKKLVEQIYSLMMRKSVIRVEAKETNANTANNTEQKETSSETQQKPQNHSLQNPGKTNKKTDKGKGCC